MLNNRGEAIDYLCDTYGPETQLRLMKEIRIPLSSVGLTTVWLYEAKEDDSPKAAHSGLWLTADEKLLATGPHMPSITEAYRQAKGQPSQEGDDMWLIEQAMQISEEIISMASFDERLVQMVDTVHDSKNYPLDYAQLAATLDELEEDYELSPLEMVQAYHKCEGRKLTNQEASANG